MANTIKIDIDFRSRCEAWNDALDAAVDVVMKRGLSLDNILALKKDIKWGREDLVGNGSYVTRHDPMRMLQFCIARVPNNNEPGMRTMVYHEETGKFWGNRATIYDNGDRLNKTIDALRENYPDYSIVRIGVNVEISPAFGINIS